jgi:hypothetical protein
MTGILSVFQRRPHLCRIGRDLFMATHKAAQTQESGKSSDDMDENDDEIAHLRIIAKHGIAWG